MELKVGQKVLVQAIGNAGRHHGGELSEDEISKIGRKYFELKGGYGRFNINTLIQDNGQYSPNYCVWLSREEFNNKVLRDRLFEKIRPHFSHYTPNITLDQAKAICNILGIKTGE